MSSREQSSDLVDLCRLIVRESHACRALLETIQEERVAIRRLAIRDFYSINCRRFALLESLQRLAQEADELIRKVAAGRGFPQVTSLEMIIDRLTPEDSSDLRAHYRSFMEIARSVRTEIEQNAVLIDGVRALIDQAVSAASAVSPGQDGYGSDGRRTRTPSVNVLLYQQG